MTPELTGRAGKAITDKLSWLQAVRESKRNQSDDNRCDEGATVNPLGGRAQLLNLVLISDALFACVHVARPARSHRDSSLLARLKEP